jgi:Fe-S cluster assembly iron-binding protein IscA
MISVTDEAAVELRSLLKAAKATPGRAVRLSPNHRGGLTMGVAEPAADDTVITYNGMPVLIIAASICQALDGLIFDYDRRVVDGEPHNNFIFRKAASVN